jgi:molybdenum cofactor cytidylyltransferase
VNVTCVVLGAGESKRMGRPKLLLAFGERTLIERAIAACACFETVIVASERVASTIPPAPRRQVIVNHEPRRGMTHSLRLADAAVDRTRALLVLPGDLPFVDAALIERVAHAPEADVAYPVCGHRPGHPVRFSPRARALLPRLADGDTLRLLRDEPSLTRVPAGVAEPDSQLDIDDPAAYDGALARLREESAQ